MVDEPIGSNSMYASYVLTVLIMALLVQDGDYSNQCSSLNKKALMSTYDEYLS